MKTLTKNALAVLLTLSTSPLWASAASTGISSQATRAIETAHKYAQEQRTKLTNITGSALSDETARSHLRQETRDGIIKILDPKGFSSMNDLEALETAHDNLIKEIDDSRDTRARLMDKFHAGSSKKE